MGRFSDIPDVFTNENALRDDYEPEELLEREDEVDDLAAPLESIAQGQRGGNVFVYGQTGLGKTLSTKKLLEELKEDVAEKPDHGIKVVWQNCHSKSAYQAAIALANRMRDGDDEKIRAGYQKEEIHDMIWEGIRQSSESHIVFVLDEVDSIATDEDDGLLYQLSRAHENKDVDLGEKDLSIIGISNNFRFRENLDSATRSGLCETEVHFGPYNANQLRSILHQRADEAFEEGVIGDAVIPKIAAEAARDTGSARHAIDILHKAGVEARKQRIETIDEELAAEAINLVQRGRIMDELRELPSQTHYVLAAIVSLSKQNTERPSTSEIYDRYQRIVKQFDGPGASVLSQRTIHNRLSDLSLSGFLSFRQVNKGKGGGMYNTYKLEMPRDPVESVLEEESGVLGGAEQTELI